jgi:malate dehydrogenase (oxaloacetate-decarboxylating)(NADP+)
LLQTNYPHITIIPQVEYSQIYRNPEGLFVSILDKGSVSSVVRNWPKPHSQARIAVITDGSRILGLGDLGVNGMPISIGKLSLYIAGAGIHPDSTIPICLDLGTNNERNLSDPLYLGLKRRRSSEKEVST